MNRSERLKKYLPYSKMDISVFLFEQIDSLKPKEKEFDQFISNYPLLVPYKADLLYFYKFYYVEIGKAYDKVNRDKNIDFDFSNEAIKLLKFLKENTNDRILFNSPNDNIKINSPQLIDYIIENIVEKLESIILMDEIFSYPTYEEYLTNYETLCSYVANFKDKLHSKEKWEDLKKVFVSKKSSFFLLVKNLYYLYWYLKEETYFKDETNVSTYQFIIDFTTICGLNWNDVSLIPMDYIKDIFKRLSYKGL